MTQTIKLSECRDRIKAAYETGSIVFLDLESGKIGGYHCDYANLEDIAEDFSSLILSLVEQALELKELSKEL